MDLEEIIPKIQSICSTQLWKPKLTCSFSTPSARGTLGPQISISSSATRNWASRANARANITATVVLPTPPLPLKTRIICFTDDNRWPISTIAGSTRRVSPDEQIDWFGQPAQAETRPATVLDVPGQAWGASEGTSSPASQDKEKFQWEIARIYIYFDSLLKSSLVCVFSRYKSINE